MYKINSGNHTFDVTLNGNAKNGDVNGEEVVFDLANVGENAISLLHNNKSYNVQVVKADYANKAFSLVVNGHEYEVSAKDDFDVLLDKMGLSAQTVHKLNTIKAPMPGLVLEVLVSVGQEVKKDTPLLILEAMKMENMLKSPGEGKVKSIGIKKGDAVEKNFVLLTFE
jgi:biotin carboxyl carrier protein